MPHTVFLSIGSNIGDTVKNCQSALDLIERHEDIKIIKISPFYRTEPWGDIKQEWFVNCVAKIETSLLPIHLLKRLQNIEDDFGRKRPLSGSAKGCPRVIDIDILFFNNMVIEEDDLVIPHPLLHKREFVLIPFLEIEPLFVHPVFNKTISQLKIELKDEKQVIRLEDI